MDPWSAHEDDRPYIRPVRSFNPWLAVAAIGIAAWLGAFYFRYSLEQPTAPAPSAAPPPAVPAPTAEPAVRHALETPASSSLPTLENSDSLLRDSAAGLIGKQAFSDLVVRTQLVRRVVATVDNLPRSTAPTRAMPFNPVPGAFDGANFERYAPYVHVIEALDAHALVQGYARLYPLFQRAYEELGFPGKYFNDRLMEAIDDLVAAPELATPPNVLRSRVRYEFSDPDLETRSAGQKILLRMGPENAARVKDKLWQIRRELIAASSRRP